MGLPQLPEQLDDRIARARRPSVQTGHLGAECALRLRLPHHVVPFRFLQAEGPQGGKPVKRQASSRQEGQN